MLAYITAPACLPSDSWCDAALQVIDGPSGAAVPLPADRLQLRAAALVRSGDLAAAAACYKQAVLAAPDDWQSWQLYLDCLLPGSVDRYAGGGGCGRFPVGVVGGLADLWDRRQAAAAAVAAVAPAGGAEAAVAAAEAEQCITQLAEAVSSNAAWRQQRERGTLRAPHLWRCELLLRRRQVEGEEGGWGGEEDLAAAVAQAFASLAANFSCLADLRPYLEALEGSAAAEGLAASLHRLAAELNERGGRAAAAAAVNGSVDAGTSSGGGGGTSGEVQRLQRLVNAYALEQELSLPRLATAGEAVARAGRLLQLYRQHLHLSGAPPPPLRHCP